MNQWQPIETAPTGAKSDVLVFIPRWKINQIMQARNVTGSQWWVTGIGAVEPTHWMPIPEPPK